MELRDAFRGATLQVGARRGALGAGHSDGRGQGARQHAASRGQGQEVCALGRYICVTAYNGDRVLSACGTTAVAGVVQLCPTPNFAKPAVTPPLQ